jgi:hypothetical protein
VVYVGLDFSLPEMPGAFTFDPDGSVESIDVGRTRLVPRMVDVPLPSVEALLPSPSMRGGEETHRPAPRRIVTVPAVAWSCLPRASCPSSASSEEPH